MNQKLNRKLHRQLHEKSRALARLIGRDHHMDDASIDDLASETRDKISHRARKDPKLAAKLYRQAWVQGRYIRTTMYRLALAMLQRRARVGESSLELLPEFINDPPGPLDATMGLAEAEAVVSKVRSELRPGGRAEKVLDLVVNGQPVPTAKRAPTWFKDGLSVLESVTRRVLRERFDKKYTDEFFEAIAVLRGVHQRRIQVVSLETQREEVLARATQFLARRGEIEFTRRLDYLQPETYDFWLNLNSKTAAAVLEDLGHHYLPGAGDPVRPRAASPYDEFLEHIFRLKEALFEPI
jgi:hypothetical protein